MTDPVGFSAAIIGITGFALQCTKLLLRDLEGLRDAPTILERLTADVRALGSTLELLADIEDTEWESLGSKIAEHSKEIIRSCAEACEHFRNNLQRWRKHSNGKQLIWRDRANVGIFKQAQIKAMSDQLVHCKLTIDSVIQIANLYSSLRQQKATKELIASNAAGQDAIKATITDASKLLSELEGKFQELGRVDGTSSHESSRLDQDQVLLQLAIERQTIETTRSLLQELLDRTEKQIVAAHGCSHRASAPAVTFGNQNSGFQAFTINGGVSGLSFGRG